MDMNPMATAPKDREILVKLDNGKFCAAVWYSTSAEGNGLFTPGEGVCSYDCSIAGDPVGWYELPE